MTWLEIVVDRVVDAVARGGLVGLGVAMAAESVFPPIPSEAVLPLAGFAVSDGRLPLLPTVVVATLGSVVGAVILYLAGRYGGRPLLYRFAWLLRTTPDDLDRADAWFDRHGPALVLWARFVPLLRSVVSVPAGMSRMPWPTFLTYTTLGSLGWNAALIGTGLALGPQWEQVTVRLEGSSMFAVAGLVAVATVVLTRRRRHRRMTASGSRTLR